MKGRNKRSSNTFGSQRKRTELTTLHRDQNGTNPTIMNKRDTPVALDATKRPKRSTHPITLFIRVDGKRPVMDKTKGPQQHACDAKAAPSGVHTHCRTATRVTPKLEPWNDPKFHAPCGSAARDEADDVMRRPMLGKGLQLANHMTHLVCAWRTDARGCHCVKLSNGAYGVQHTLLGDVSKKRTKFNSFGS
eukprot:5263125-Amphidinium_carterae.1